MTQVDLMSLGLVSTTLSLIFCSTRSAKLRFSRKPPLPRAYPRDKLNVFELKRSLPTSPEQDQPQVQILRLSLFRLLGCLLLKCLPRNADRPQQGWTRQFLGGIAQLSCHSPAEARQPIDSVGRISPPHALPSCISGSASGWLYIASADV